MSNYYSYPDDAEPPRSQKLILLNPPRPPGPTDIETARAQTSVVDVTVRTEESQQVGSTNTNSINDVPATGLLILQVEGSGTVPTIQFTTTDGYPADPLFLNDNVALEANTIYELSVHVLQDDQIVIGGCTVLRAFLRAGW